MGIRRITRTSTPHLERQALQWGNVVVICSLLLVLYATLFPFNFSLEIATGFDLKLAKPASLGDWLRNILLFLPFGFGFSCLIEKRTRRGIAPIIVILIASFGLSLTVEVLQLFLSERTSTVTDILANTVGGFLGFLGFRLWGVKILGHASALVAKTKGCLSIPKLTVGFIGYATFTFLISIPLQSTTLLSNWNPNFPLLLGNEQTGDRPWRGQISEVIFADRAISKSEVARVFSELNPLTIIGDSLVASYQFTGRGVYSDGTGNLPDLTWRGDPPDTGEGMGVQMSSSHWLETAAPAAFLTQRLRETSQFTSIATVATADTNQTGPARIISLSKDPSQRNFTLGQSGNNLVFRLRTPVTGKSGSQPELSVPNIFTDTKPHHVVVTYDGSVLGIYVDRLKPEYSLELTPGSTLFWQLLYLPYFPTVTSWTIDANAFSTQVYKILYYGLIFIPLGSLLALITKLSSGGSIFRLLSICAGLFLPPLILETILMSVSGRSMRLDNLLLSLAIVNCSMLLCTIQAPSQLRLGDR